ncbi:cyclase family protein [Croceitalea marina]|uniref:Cyclase family protein n=1 Tax=Croceitalea marina TaxID=1775166 RepID=A0ABW5MVG6_9FLAO
MAKNRIIDLTQPISEAMAGVSIEQSKSIETDGWNASTLHLYSHSGTHMDAPIHFDVTRQTLDQIPIERFISRAWVIDLDGISPSEKITLNHLGSNRNLISHGDSVLLKTGWSKYIGQSKYRDELPRISEELAHWLGEKQINILGVEPPSVADVNNIEEVTKIHTILMKNDILILEGLTNLDKIEKNEVTLMAFPLNYKNGDGAPARVLVSENLNV